MATLKQQMAAKKAAKAERKLREQVKAVIGAGFAKTPQDAAMLARLRRNNLIKMQCGAPADIDDQLTATIRDYCRLDDLVERHDVRLTAYFAHQARLAILYGAIYDDPRIRHAARDAEAAINISYDARHRPPAERKTILHPLAELTEWLHAYRQIVPSSTAVICVIYAHAAHTLLNGMDYAALPKWHQDALYRIIRGQSLRSIAQDHKQQGNPVTESALREIILNAAGHAYHTLNAYGMMPEPVGIPVLRDAAWRPFADPECLAGVIDRAKATVNRFEYETGISVLNYKRFREQAVAAALESNNYQ